jgi:LmbE family N-acetylglucosaminyl deacetylase
MHLPDGNLNGQGFGSASHQSLSRLQNRSITHIDAVDGQSSYTLSELNDALVSLMHSYQPAEIRTQSAQQGHKITDHSDHGGVGRIVKHAHDLYQQQQFESAIQVPLVFYLGYQGRELPANVSGDDLAKKEATFFVYANHDGAACNSPNQCRHIATYPSYLERQYRVDN